MICKFLPVTLFAILFFVTTAFAGHRVNDTTLPLRVEPPVERFFVGNAMDGAVFSSANIKRGSATTTGILRFSYIINFGFTFNYNPGRHFGIYSGIDVKNVGFIEHHGNGSIQKYRTYNVGIPIGVKIGNMAKKKCYGFFGGGLDMPVNYKEKYFFNRSNKQKLSEWFGNRTPLFTPYVFAGFAIRRGVTFKAQYYPNNFFNPDYSVMNTKPYATTDVHLLLLSVGINVRFSKGRDFVSKSVSGLNTI